MDSKLKYLLNLADDETAEVREEVLKAFRDYGPDLEKDILEFAGLLDPQKLSLINPFIQINRRNLLRKNWSSWLNVDDYFDKIEMALSLIARYQYGEFSTPNLSKLLDSLTEEFMNKTPYGDELDLANFLFQVKGITGAKEDYNNPFNSNAVYAIKEKKGLPITLCLIYVLVGNRLGFLIKGCNFPGHFLAKVEMEDEIILVDCFNSGRFFYEESLEEIMGESASAVAGLLKTDVPAQTIIKRVLNNLINSYSFIGDTVNHQFFTELLNQIK